MGQNLAKNIKVDPSKIHLEPKFLQYDTSNVYYTPIVYATVTIYLVGMNINYENGFTIYYYRKLNVIL